ncbi:putative membrane protein YdbT with pleckstrin-like domain [Nocardiopsis mwathae]|uniref:Putative membrane protein YdbT with pleckstrin-like domain n=1 Tax=Nocardiopsis mwathae TaxID=1472723 RepID=A0A7W9YN11_9ACTN|nr:hypothetical protein [Nocardiopsis mwathae]MBB6174990.1 putative membrane protein YdbT with pleckstrin-like domain [Nocardiopsis mwathae]
MRDGHRPIRPGGAGGSADVPEARLVRILVRALVVAAAGIMATGFFHWRAGLLVAVLTAITAVLLARRHKAPPP